MTKKKGNDLEYSIVGATLYEIQDKLVRGAVGAISRGKDPWGTFILGQPGIGKTYTVYAAAKRIAKDLGVETVPVKCLLTSCCDPVDITGFPSVVPNTNYADYFPLKWVYEASTEAENQGPMILFFDDLPTAHPQTQAAFFKLVHERMAGDLKLRSNVIMVAAGNRVEDSSAAQEVPLALANRFRWYYATASIDDWLDWAVKEGKIHPTIVAYLRKNNEHLNDFDGEVAMSSEKGIATPRSWENLSDAFYENEFFDTPDPTFNKTIVGTIGRGIATSLQAFIKTTRSAVAPQEIVNNPKKAMVPMKENIDLLFATLSGLERYVRDNPKFWRQALIYGNRDEIPAEYALMLCRSIVELMDTFSEKDKIEAYDAPEFKEMFKKYSDHIALL